MTGEAFGLRIKDNERLNQHSSIPAQEDVSVTTATASEIRAHLSDLLSRVARRGNRVVVTRGGKKYAALVPLDDLDFLEALESRLDLEDAKKALKEPGSVPWKKVKAELGL